MIEPNLKPNSAWGCIWCGKTPRTKEHLWPQWYSEIIPKVRNHHIGLRFKVRHTSELTYINPQFRKRAADPSSLKLKVVCKNCNSGWKSKIEESAKPALSSMITGKSLFLNPEDQRAIFDWAVLKTIIGEFDDEPDTRAIGFEARQAFFRRREFPGVWKVWIGYLRSEGAWRTRYRHAPAILTSQPNSVVDPPVPNTQLSVFGGGNLFLQVLYSRISQAAMFSYAGDPAQMLQAIDPTNQNSVYWPPKRLIDDSAADRFSNALFDWPYVPGFTIRQTLAKPSRPFGRGHITPFEQKVERQFFGVQTSSSSSSSSSTSSRGWGRAV